MKFIKMITIAVICIGMIACTTSIERTAYNTIVGAKAFLDSEKKVHPECNPAPGGVGAGNNSTFCQDLQKATAAKDLLIDATEAYCQLDGTDINKACTPPAKGTPAYTSALGVLQAALNNYNQIATDLKGVK